MTAAPMPNPRCAHVAQPRPALHVTAAQAWPAPDRFTELRTVLGRWWWAWLVAFVGVCTASAGLFSLYLWLSLGPQP